MRRVGDGLIFLFDIEIEKTYKTSVSKPQPEPSDVDLSDFEVYDNPTT